MRYKVIFVCTICIIFLALLNINESWAAEVLGAPLNVGNIEGKVVSGFTGAPIAGAAVRVGGIVIPTNRGGEFAFTLVHPGIYTVYYDAPGHKGEVQEYITVEGGKTTVTPTVIFEANTGEIRGKVSSAATGLPLPGAAVRINNITAFSDAQGDFVFTLVHPGVYTVNYEAPGHLGQTQEVIAVYEGVHTTPPMVVLSADGPPNVVIKLSENRLYLYYGSYLVKSYPIATGMRGWPTPLGLFTIIRKDINPTWYPPSWADEEKPVPPGPKNPLGNRRLLLSDPSYGIHGTNRISSIGKYVTHGCIRLYPWDILDLFDRVQVGNEVDIVK